MKIQWKNSFLAVVWVTVLAVTVGCCGHQMLPHQTEVTVLSQYDVDYNVAEHTS